MMKATNGRHLCQYTEDLLKILACIFNQTSYKAYNAKQNLLHKLSWESLESRLCLRNENQTITQSIQNPKSAKITNRITMKRKFKVDNVPDIPSSTRYPHEIIQEHCPSVCSRK